MTLLVSKFCNSVKSLIILVTMRIYDSFHINQIYLLTLNFLPKKDVIFFPFSRDACGICNSNPKSTRLEALGHKKYEYLKVIFVFKVKNDI